MRLASQLTGWQIDLITETQESERRQREFAERTELFQEALDVDEVIAQLLVTEGFATVEEIAFVEQSRFLPSRALTKPRTEELQARAREYLDKEAAELDARRRELGVDDAVLDVEGVTLPMAVAFGENDVKTVEDLAGLVPDDLRGWFETNKDGERVRQSGVLESFGITAESAEHLIMHARVAAGWVDPSELEPEEAAEGEYAEGEEADAGLETQNES